MPHHDAGPLPAMFDRAGSSTLGEWMASRLALTRAPAS